MNRTICLNRSVLDFMELKLTRDSFVIEFGSGWSTRWLADRCGRLLSFETSPEWVERVTADLKGAPCRWDVRLVDDTCLDIPVSNNRVDLVLVDSFERSREMCAMAAWPLLRFGGWLIFDDAQRPMHTPVVRHFNRLAKPIRLAWDEQHDIPEARERVALAWQKPV